MKLGTLLLRNAVISLTQLEEALRAQVMMGGRLGTNLVESRLLDLDALADALGELSGLPVATPALLDAATPQTLGLLDAATCARLGVIPLATLPGPPPTLALAMVDPGDGFARDELAATTGLEIAPHVIPELRLLYYLERAYGLPRVARFVRAGGRPRAAEPDDRRRAQPAGGLEPPPPLRVEPRRSRQTTPPPAPPAEAPPAETPTVTVTAVGDRIDQASHRDHIAEALADYAAGRFGALVVFVVRDGNALGWQGRLEAGAPAAPLPQLALPLGPASALQDAHDGQRPHHGPPASTAHPVETRLWEALGTPPPSEVLVVPVVVRQRVVNLVYAHGVGGGPIPAALADELARLAGRAADAYVQLIRRSRT